MAYEADFQRQLLLWLKRHKIEHWRMPLGPVVRNGGQWTKNPLKGFPDIMGLLTKEHHGKAWALELKSPTGKITKEQTDWLARLKMHGAAVAVITNLAEAHLFFEYWGEL